VGELPDTLLNIPIASLDLTKAQEKDEPDWGLQQLQNTMHQNPVSQRSVTESTWSPVHRQEDATWYRYQHARYAAKEHHYLDKPRGLFWVLLNHIQEWVRVVRNVVCSIEE